MDNTVTFMICALFCTIVCICIMALKIINRQHEIIQELTAKIMARDFKEYVSMSTQPQPDKPKPKKQSWYDTESEIEDMQ